MLEKVLDAESVAVVGASKNETKRGYQTIRTLLEEKYEGAIYPVNPKETSILGFKCHKAVSEIDGFVDLALIATPARTLPSVLEDCGKKGVQGAVILAGGFGETGQDGRQLENDVVAIATTPGTEGAGAQVGCCVDEGKIVSVQQVVGSQTFDHHVNAQVAADPPCGSFHVMQHPQLRHEAHVLVWRRIVFRISHRYTFFLRVCFGSRCGIV